MLERDAARSGVGAAEAALGEVGRRGGRPVLERLFGTDYAIKLPNLALAFGAMAWGTAQPGPPPFWALSAAAYIGLVYLTLVLIPFNAHRIGLFARHKEAVRALVRRRRTFGLMAALWFWAHYHFAVELLRRTKSVDALQADYDPVLDPGQMAIFIFLILFLTSYGWARRLLKSNWKRLQSLVWFAVPLILVHSISAKLRIQDAATHVTTLVLSGFIAFAVYEFLQLSKRGHPDRFRHIALIALGLGVGLFLRFVFRETPLGA
ncbi:MAG: hypothetical protein MI723_19335 [Caulobacterales bacterium]|nr:hypothetical protein [Caulobacterales bacterium]